MHVLLLSLHIPEGKSSPSRLNPVSPWLQQTLFSHSVCENERAVHETSPAAVSCFACGTFDFPCRPMGCCGTDEVVWSESLTSMTSLELIAFIWAPTVAGVVISLISFCRWVCKWLLLRVAVFTQNIDFICPSLSLAKWDLMGAAFRNQPCFISYYSSTSIMIGQCERYCGQSYYTLLKFSSRYQDCIGFPYYSIYSSAVSDQNRL